ncbi:MAG: hypothetical protein AAGF32_03445, partial [Pseudomonadota bacterium]
MSQRLSGWERRRADLYETPRWVGGVLLDHLEGEDLLAPAQDVIYEPAAGPGRLVRLFAERGYQVSGRDLLAYSDAQPGGIDFTATLYPPLGTTAIITNPPYGHAGRTAEAFIRNALGMLASDRCDVRLVAMLLRPDFDSGSTRTDMFADCAHWGHRLVLLNRIYWVEPQPDENGRTSGPSENHVWWIWTRDLVQRGTGYAAKPRDAVEIWQESASSKSVTPP